MDVDTAIDSILDFQQRIYSLIEAGPRGNWTVTWNIIRNDLDEFIAVAFADQSTDYTKLDAALRPMGLSIGGDPWRNFVADAKYVHDALQVVEHRLRNGQSVLKKSQQDEILIEPGTPHSAYVKLRELVEGASIGILLVDPYVDRTVLDLLSNVPKAVKIRILTRQANLPGDFATEAIKFKQQHSVQVEVRLGLSDIHDRFLLVDDRLFFSGASFKDLGKKGSMVIEIFDVKTQTAAALEASWNAAKVLV